MARSLTRSYLFSLSYGVYFKKMVTEFCHFAHKKKSIDFLIFISGDTIDLFFKLCVEL